MTTSPVRACLIGGTGRSGTTVLRSIFGRHPRVAALPVEARLLTDPDGLVDFYDAYCAGWSPFSFDVKIRRLRRLLEDLGGRKARSLARRDVVKPFASSLNSRTRRAIARVLPRYYGLGLGADNATYYDLIRGLMLALEDFSYEGRWIGSQRWQESSVIIGPRGEPGEVAAILGRFYVAVLREVAAQGDATHVVEDSPFNLLAFDRTLQLLPDARLVHIYRDPRDVVASMTQVNWGPSEPAVAARLFVRIADQWQSMKGRLPVGSYREISLERLVADPRYELQKLCSLWDLPFDEAMLGEDLTRSHAARWKSDLTAAEGRRVSEIVAPYLELYGYT